MYQWEWKGHSCSQGMKEPCASEDKNRQSGYQLKTGYVVVHVKGKGACQVKSDHVSVSIKWSNWLYDACSLLGVNHPSEVAGSMMYVLHWGQASQWGSGWYDICICTSLGAGIPVRQWLVC